MGSCNLEPRVKERSCYYGYHVSNPYNVPGTGLRSLSRLNPQGNSELLFLFYQGGKLSLREVKVQGHAVVELKLEWRCLILMPMLLSIICYLLSILGV